jgi:hypothetical protein
MLVEMIVGADPSVAYDIGIQSGCEKPSRPDGPVLRPIGHRDGVDCGGVDPGVDRGEVATTTCPSCGYTAPVYGGSVESRFRASAECYAAYQELAAYNLTGGRRDFIHQEAVDAYAAQHPGPPAKPMATWFGLVGLHLALDLGRTGREVQQAHMRLARRRRHWPELAAPADLTGMVVADVMQQPADDTRDDALWRWAGEVWEHWAAVHQVIADLCADQGL